MSRTAGKHQAAPYSGVPVLFLPGSGGSYEQVRSLASETAKQHAASGGAQLDWFTLDFREELSAFDATLLERQRMFLLDVLLFLDAKYVARTGADAPVFVLVGHSMGGVVALAAMGDVRLSGGVCPRQRHPLTTDARRRRRRSGVDVSSAALITVACTGAHTHCQLIPAPPPLSRAKVALLGVYARIGLVSSVPVVSLSGGVRSERRWR